MSVYTAIPSYRGYDGWSLFTMAIIDFAKQMPDDWFIRITHGGQGTCRARNQMTRDMLDSNKYEWILYADDDEMWRYKAVEGMLHCKHPIVSGLVPRTQFPHHPPIGDFHKKDSKARNLLDFPWDKTFEVDWSGSGFLLVNRSVLEKMDDPWWEKVEAPEYMAEDLYFCKKMKEKLGIRVLVDPRAQVAHINGDNIVTMSDFKHALRMGNVWRWDEDPAYYPR